ncbi:DUF1990 family protein [Streptomyces boncukensis]|uniref:DUF1990 domain-containing protein n=1 Tax=Streptomyces boncukensis TaxID=2711219 RepID=A0A6G4WSW1_9ACTN|nr:DUF1990 domain-containing protein [Streptomyces boncukensis]
MTGPPAPLTYAPVGATAQGGTPPGFNGLRVRTRLGSGEAVFRAAAHALMTWRLHRRMGVRITADAERAAPGATVTVGLGAGPLRVRGPCRVVWAVQEPHRAGWAYGTLPGHPECGEEAFTVHRDGDGTVWLTVTAYSRPGVWWTRAAGPLVPVFQRGYARYSGLVLRRLARRAAGGRTGAEGRPGPARSDHQIGQIGR